MQRLNELTRISKLDAAPPFDALRLPGVQFHPDYRVRDIRCWMPLTDSGGRDSRKGEVMAHRGRGYQSVLAPWS